MSTYGSFGIGLKSRPRNGLICLSEFAALLAGGGNSPQYRTCLDELCIAFSAGDERLVWCGDPQSNANITNSEAIKYWTVILPELEVPDRLIEPAEITDLITLVEALRDENSRLRNKLENTNQTSVKNATPFMAICVDVFNRYWADTEGDDNESIKTGKTIEEWILDKYKDTSNMSHARAREIQRMSRPSWAVSLGGRPKNNC